MKRLLSLLILAAMVLTLIPAFAVAAAAADGEKTEIEVKWNSGYVGGNTNKNYKNRLSGASATYKYSDIITVPKAGTKISFTDASCAGDSGTYYVSNTAYVFSVWTNDTTIDLAAANVVGTYQYASLGQKPVGTAYTDGMYYEYITDKDNQKLRICYRCTAADTETPKVYSQTTTDTSTKAQLDAYDFTATLAGDGRITGLRWFSGYASSATNDNGSAKEIKVYQTEYAFSNLFKVPSKGTKITFTITSTASPSSAFNAVTTYKYTDGRYVYEDGVAANDTSVMQKNGSTYTYTYITSADNEILRIGLRPYKAYKQVDVDEPVSSIIWEETSQAGTLEGKVDQKTTWPDPELRSIVTGAELKGTEIDPNWHYGYFTSQYHDSPFNLNEPTKTTYMITDVFTVPKAGTTVYFFDQTFTDYDGGIAASTSFLTVSHWKKNGTEWVFDDSKPYFTGCDCKQIIMDEYYRILTYTTTEDNENIRLSMRYAPVYTTEDPLIPPTYLVESTDFELVAGTGSKLSDASFTDVTGDELSFKYYMPATDGGSLFTVIFDNSADGAVAAMIADAGIPETMAVAFSGDTASALRILDEVAKNCPVKVSDILFIGGDELAAHLKKYENLRLCQALIYTGDGAVPALEHAPVKAMSSFADAKAAAVWLLGEYEDYYNALEGLTMYAIGDSYFGGSAIGQHQTWVNLMGNKYGMSYHNYGIGGNTVALATGQSSHQPPMYRRYEELPLDGDIYILEGGRNDRRYSVPFGKNDSTDRTTFKGAMNIMIKAIREKSPNAMIVLVTPWSSLDETSYLGTNDDYAKALIELAEYYNDPHIVCLNAADREFTGIDMADASCRATYCIAANDRSHLNVDGMNFVLPKFEKWIAEKYAEFKGVTLTNDADAKDANIALLSGAGESTTADTPSTDTIGEEPGCGGCGGISLIAQLIALICGGAAFVISKKK